MLQGQPFFGGGFLNLVHFLVFLFASSEQNWPLKQGSSQNAFNKDTDSSPSVSTEGTPTEAHMRVMSNQPLIPQIYIVSGRKTSCHTCMSSS